MKALFALLVAASSIRGAAAQQVDTTLWTRLHYRFVGPEGNRAIAAVGEPGNPLVAYIVAANTGCSDLAIDPGDPNTLFAGMWQFEVKTWHLQSGGPGSGLWASYDGGVTWKRLAGRGLPDTKRVLGKIAVAVAPSNPNTIYALIEDRDPTLYRSDDRGNNWRVVSRNHDMAERAPYYVRFAVAPDDEERLYFVSVRFSMSRDGGQTLGRSGFQAGGDNHDIWIDPSNPDRMMIAHDGGASITLTGGKNWTRIVLPSAQMYHVSTDTRAPYNLYGNRQDGSSYRMPSRSLSGGLSEGQWRHVGGCESGFAYPDTVDNATVWSGCYDGGLEVYDVRTDHARNVRVWPEAGYGWG